MTLTVPQPLWELFYQGENITADIAPQVSQVEWQEHLSGAAADVSITIVDPAGKWRSSNYPQVGQDQIDLYIGYAGAPLLQCGTFSVAELEFDGPPDRVILRAVESTTTLSLRTAGNFAYENMTFTQIAQAVAARHGLACVNLPTEPNTPWARRTQTLEHGGDINFLRMISNEANYEFNVRPPNIIFYSRAAIDAQPPSNTITRAMVNRYSFRNQVGDLMISPASATVSYLDPTTKQVFTSTATMDGKPPTADKLNIVERVENNQQASLKAQSLLSEINMAQYEATFTLPGTINFRAGQTASLPARDWGAFGGTWTISRATHRIRARSDGYTTELVLRQAAPHTVLTPGGAST
jgi:uncharacterized protein